MKRLILFTTILLLLGVNANGQDTIHISTAKLKLVPKILPDSTFPLPEPIKEPSSVRLVCNCGPVHQPLWILTYHSIKYIIDSINVSSIKPNWIEDIYVTRDTAGYSRYYPAKYGIIFMTLKNNIHLTVSDSLKVLIAHKRVISVVLTPPPGYLESHPMPPKVELKNVEDSIGHKVTIEGKIFGYKKLSNMTLVDLGAANPNQLLTIVFKGKAKKHFDYFPLDGKSVFVVGKISEFKGKPRIVVTDANSFGVY